MSGSILVRWSGLAALVAGLLFALGPLVRVNEENAAAIGLEAYAAVTLVTFVGHAVFLLGLFGLFARLLPRGGALLVAGFLTLFFGTALGLIPAAIEAFMHPYLRVNGLLRADDLVGPPPPFILLTILLPVLLRAVGSILFGIAIARTGVLPRAAGVLLALGGSVFAYGSGPWLAAQALSRPSGLLVGAALLWLGYALWADAPDEQRTLAVGAPAPRPV